MAAAPLTNSVSPSGRIASGPSGRYMAMHSMNTDERTSCPLVRSSSSSGSR